MLVGISALSAVILPHFRTQCGRKCITGGLAPVCVVDRVPKKSKLAEWPAEFSVYSRDKYRNFLLTKFLKILQNAHAHQQLM